MSEQDIVIICVSCGRTEEQVPLIAIHFKGGGDWICSRCLPILIHKPEQLAQRLAGAEHIPPAAHQDH